jgi:2-polyprenyl-3-methyl-5-hydroxy-6-metoxy-1,4-benzoquinol methylase
MSTNNVVNYGWDSSEGPQSCDYIAPFVNSLVKHFQPQRVLDIGSGNGKLCDMIARNGYYVSGMEYDSTGVELSRKAYPSINFYQYGVQDNPALLLEQENREYFDLVVSTEVIEHLYSPQLLVQYAHSVLAKNGKLIITTPYHGYLKNLALSIFDKWDHHHTAHWEGGHIKFWSIKTLSELLEANGFKVIRATGVGRIPYLWKSMVVVAEKQTTS